MPPFVGGVWHRNAANDIDWPQAVEYQAQETI